LKYFEQYFSDAEFTGAEEVKVLCPFHTDTSPSASVNTLKEVFHCWVCDVGYDEKNFLAKTSGISVLEADKVLNKLNENFHNWNIVEKADLWASANMLKQVEALGFTKDTIEKLDLGLVKDDLDRPYLGIPVFYNGVLMDSRKYNLYNYNNTPKVQSPKGAQMGFIIPFDLWKVDKETTYVFEGEKDMMMARELGLNAITLTGGAGAKPNELVINAFKDRDVIICYDNDEAGRNGAEKLYLHIDKLTKSTKYVNIGDIVEENKEDFYDFVVKYEKDIFDFYDLTEREFKGITKVAPLTNIKAALAADKINKVINSEILVSAEFADTYAVPVGATLEKMRESKSPNETMMVGEKRSWYLEQRSIQQLLPLIEMSARETEVNAQIKSFAGVPAKETDVKITKLGYQTIYKVRVIDKDGDSGMISLDLYTTEQLEVGNQYRITYSIYPHPTKHQKLVAIATHIVPLSTQDGFKIDKEVLNKFKSGKTIDERVEYLYQSAKHHVAKHLSRDLWFMSDLVFNSVLEFDYGDRLRGALDVFLLGDTQVGKSETTSKLVDLYEFGHFLSLKTSTTVGLIGGSTKVDGSWLNTIGAIPRQHKKLAVLEEFSGARADFIKTMTDIRSSGRLRLARASGELNVPCRLRMITISNPLNGRDGSPRHISSFPNGIMPLMELINSPEDVARYDGFLLIEKPATRFNPFAVKLVGEPIKKELYNHKINWVASRLPEQVIFADGSDSYIWEKAQDLNKLFECNFPLFGTTAALKLARFCVALASLILETDDTYEQVIVTKEIVDYMFDYLVKIYDNDTFKLKEYKAQYESYHTISNEEIIKFQKLYARNAVMFDFLGHQTNTSRGNLTAVSGLDRDKFGIVFNQLVQMKLLRLSGDHVYPTNKFRLGVKNLDKKVKSNKVRSTEGLEMGVRK